MELGARVRQERLARGLSQRALCGDVITRNMLSQIENGTARPSMDTLRYLAARLEKPLSFFLGEEEPSGTNRLMAQARAAFQEENWALLAELLERLPTGEAFGDGEYWLLRELWLLHRADEAIRQARGQYGLELLDEAAQAEGRTVYGGLLKHRRMLLRAKVDARAPLPPEDDTLLLRARRALDAEQTEQCAGLLEACVEKDDAWWQLCGELEMRRGRYAQAADAFHKVETPALYSKLEECYRRLENYQKAYEYACKQRET